MSDSIPKIIHELNNKNFKKALNLCEKYSENNIINSIKKNKFAPKKNVYCFFCEYKKLLCPLYK